MLRREEATCSNPESPLPDSDVASPLTFAVILLQSKEPTKATVGQSEKAIRDI
jgi:hypothetical protein